MSNWFHTLHPVLLVMDELDELFFDRLHEGDLDSVRKKVSECHPCIPFDR